MSSKVNYGRYRVNTDGLVFRVDGYSQRSIETNSENWKDLTPSGLDVKLGRADLFNETSGYYKFRAGSENSYAAISGENFSGVRSLGVFKDKNSSFTIESFFQIKNKGGDSTKFPDDGAVVFGNTDHNKSGYSYGIIAHTGSGEEISGLNTVLSSNKTDQGSNHPWTGINVVLSDPLSPSIAANTFYHAAMTYNSSDGKMIGYLDGVAKDSGTFTNSEEIHQGAEEGGTYQQFYIGGNSSSGLNVDIGMVSCYNRALSSGEVFGNCQAVKHRYGGGY